MESQIKSSQAKVAELFESVHLQSTIVFGLNDELIPGVDSPSNTSSAAGICASLAFISLNPLARLTANKEKHE